MRYGFVKVAAAVPFVKVADCFYNVGRIRNMIIEADECGVEIITFPELSVTGYTCGDLFLQPFLLEEAKRALVQLVSETAHTSAMVIVGMPVRVEEKLFNAAVVFQRGKILGAIPKTYLPNYREFQEKRWFSPSTDLKFSHVKIGDTDVPIGCNLLFRSGTVGVGIEICEDVWTPYTPGTRLSLYGAQIIFNLSASNENAGKHAYLRSLISGLSSQSISAYVYSSCGYGESSTDLVYTGKAFIAELGTIIEEMKRFEYGERMIINDIDVARVQTERLINSSFKSAVSQLTDDDMKEVHFHLRSYKDSKPITRPVPRNPFMPNDGTRAERSAEMLDIQVCALRQRLDFLKTKHAIIGVSGGLDSTLALLVIARTFDEMGLDRSGIIAVTMPGFGTTNHTYSNAVALIKELGCTFKEIDIRESCANQFKTIGHDPEVHNVTYENVQARERTRILMDLGNHYNGPVIGTGDLSELALGWCTYNGDHMSMYAVNSSIPKTSIQVIVSHIATSNMMGEAISPILKAIVETPISPELLPTDGKAQHTEDIIGPYELHDFFLYHFLYNEFPPEKIIFLAAMAFDGKYNRAEIKRVLRIFFKRFFAQQYKRNCMPDGPKVGCISLSPRGEWRMPSDAVSDMWLQEVDRIPD